MSTENQITVDGLKEWYAAQKLTYASRTEGKYTFRLNVSQFSDFPTYEVTKRNFGTMADRKELYYGGDIAVAVRIFNEAQ